MQLYTNMLTIRKALGTISFDIMYTYSTVGHYNSPYHLWSTYEQLYVAQSSELILVERIVWLKYATHY